MSPLTGQEREQILQDLNLDRPVVEASTTPVAVVGVATPGLTYRQERRAQAQDGANIRASVGFQ